MKKIVLAFLATSILMSTSVSSFALNESDILTQDPAYFSQESIALREKRNELIEQRAGASKRRNLWLK